jgi:hypothetical protein
MENLEARQFLSASLDEGTLTVKGTPGEDAIVVRQGKDGSSLVVEINGAKTSFLRKAVDRVTVFAGRGADRVSIEGLTDAGVTVYGGPGKDIVSGAADQVGVRAMVQPFSGGEVEAYAGAQASDPIPTNGHVATGVLPRGEPVPTAPGSATPGDELRAPPVPLAAPPIPISNTGGGGTPTGGTTDPGGQTTTGDPNAGGTGNGGGTDTGGGTATDGGQTNSASPFQVFDATLFTDKPNLNPLGVPRVLLGESIIFKQVGTGYDMSKPDEAATRSFARLAADRQQMIIIDIEDWPIDIRSQTDAAVQHTIDMFIQIVDWVHSERPEVKIGFYGLVPLSDYWTPVSYDKALDKSVTSPWWAEHLPQFEANFKAWQAANDRLDVLASKVDFLSPSLYTFYEDQDGWQRYAKWNVEEAKRYGKPVYPFLWMDYHDSNAALKGQLLPVDYWNMELQTLKQSADGVVIWGGWQEQWDPQAPWVQATEQFIATLS